MVSKPREQRTSLWTIAIAILLLSFGLVLIAGGAQLALLGGSWYYLLAGIAIFATGALVWRGSGRAPQVYALLLVATLAWAIAEVGFAWWELAPRIGLLLGIGLVFCLPIRNRVSSEKQKAPIARQRIAWLAVSLVAIGLGAAIHSTQPVRFNPMFQNGIRGWTDNDERRAAGPIPAGLAGDWLHYGNDAGGMRYSGLDEIKPDNVAQLEPVWSADLGPTPKAWLGGMQATPLKVGDSLYTCTEYNDVFAIDAETGKIKWRFHSGIDMVDRSYGHCRGVAYYRAAGVTGICAERIITNTIDARLIAIDAKTGQRCPAFGTNGETSLLTGMGEVEKGYYHVTSAPTVVRGKIVLGGWVMDGQYWGEPSGVIRAYDAVTGKFAWAFDVGRPDQHGEPGTGETYTRSTPNSWAQ